jgi:hypothetical protein
MLYSRRQLLRRVELLLFEMPASMEIEDESILW